MNVKPILFNTEMVRAILAGRKTQTRRIVKPRPIFDKDGWWMLCKAVWPQSHITLFYQDGDPLWQYAPCKPGDTLWVRETWSYSEGEYRYKADDEMPDGWHTTAWRPSIHMPKEAARIFLRVKEVRLQRIRTISGSDAMDEGANSWPEFIEIWDSTIKPAERGMYSWAANPWVWVIEFERCEQPEGWEDSK